MQTNPPLDNHINTLMAEQHIPGLALLISRNGVADLACGYGLANVELAVPVTADTVFEIASVTKLFTAIAVTQLIDARLIAPDASILAYLPQLPAAWASAHIQHLLSHTSGIPNYTDAAAYWQSTRLDVSREQILELVTDQPLQFPAGSDYAYSNTGYYLLGLVIEAVSGQSYGEYLDAHIFGPLGMNSTVMNDPYAIVPGRAAGYTWQDETLRRAEYYSNAGTYAAGALLSTIADLAKWAAALYDDSLLPQASRRAMWTPARETIPFEARLGFTVGRGWFIFQQFRGRPRRWIGHNGGIKGFSSSVQYLLDDAITIVTLINRDGFARPDLLIGEDALLTSLRLA